jgi:hypothetical protein
LQGATGSICKRSSCRGAHDGMATRRAQVPGARGRARMTSSLSPAAPRGRIGSLTMTAKVVKVTIVRDGSMCFVPVPFDPKAVFGKVRAPVKVTLNGYTYRSTIASMGGTVGIPLRRSNREAAGLEGGETIKVTIALDTDAREVDPPADLVRALKADPPAWERWRDVSYTEKREHVEGINGARKPDTRARRIERAVRAVGSRPAKKTKGK